MSTTNEVLAVATDAGLALVSVELAKVRERHDFDLAVDAAHQKGETLSREEILAEFEKTDAAIKAWREKVLASMK